MNKLHKRRTTIGVTLIELLVTLTILSILTAIGYPNYVKFKLETNRAEATTTLTNMYNAINNYLLASNSVNAANAISALYSSFPILTTPNNYYTIDRPVTIATTSKMKAQYAWYGAPNDTTKRNDITDAINSSINAGQTSIAATNGAFGDPAPTITKKMSITFASGLTLTCSENSSITFPIILYTITATAATDNSQVNDLNCKTFTIDNYGNTTSTKSTNASSTGCW